MLWIVYTTCLVGCGILFILHVVMRSVDQRQFYDWLILRDPYYFLLMHVLILNIAMVMAFQTFWLP